MKILITGSSGHLGEALVRTLKSSHNEVIGIDIKPSEYTTNVGSITDRKFVKNCLSNVNAVIHTATLHKPHVATHSYQDFINTNITGTLNLLEESKIRGIESFVYTSTTSTFGDMLTPQKNEPSIWITEQVRPIPKNIYGVTKTAAEDLCQLFYRNYKLPCIILKTSRFFPEKDDNQVTRESYSDDNSKANELLYRRVDIQDVVSAHILAMEKAKKIGFGKYIISATSPFTKSDLKELRLNAPSVIEKIYPNFKKMYALKNWKMFQEIDRVYVNDKARNELNWQPQYNFGYVLKCLKEGKDFRSQLSKDVGIKGYHSQEFGNRVYPF